MDRKSTEVHGGNSESKWMWRVEPTIIPGSKLTKRCWNTQHCGMGQTLHRGCFCPHSIPNILHPKQGGVNGAVDMAELILCWLSSGFLNLIQSTEHLPDCAISPQTYKFILNTFGNIQHFRWTHSVCQTARALPHFAFSRASLWIWWTKLIQIHQILLKCLKLWSWPPVRALSNSYAKGFSGLTSGIFSLELNVTKKNLIGEVKGW